MKTYPLFVVPIGNAKITEKIVFHPASPVLKYHQNASHSCCLSGLSSNFHSIDEDRSETALANCIEEYLTLQTDIFSNTIDFASDIMKNKLRHKGEQCLRYNIKR